MTTTTSKMLSQHIQPIYLSHAQLFTYNQEDESRQWLPVYTNPVPTSIMFDATRGLYRLISVDPSCKHVIANSTIVTDLEFHKTSQRFGHWTDMATGTVYGIGFKTEQQLEDFEDCIRRAKSAFSGGSSKHQNFSSRTSKTKVCSTVPQLNFENTSPVHDDQKTNLRELITRLSLTTEPPIEVLIPPRNTQQDYSALRIQTPHNPSDSTTTISNDSSTHHHGDPSSSVILSEITRLRRENSEMKAALSQNVRQYHSWELQLSSLHSQNTELSKALHQLDHQIQEKKQLNLQLTQEVDLLRDSYLSGANACKGVTILEEKLARLQLEKGSLSGAIVKMEQGEGEGGCGCGPTVFDCSKQAAELERHYKGLLEGVNRELSLALEENMTGKETVIKVEGLFNKALLELMTFQKELKGAFQQGEVEQGQGAVSGRK